MLPLAPPAPAPTPRSDRGRIDRQHAVSDVLSVSRFTILQLLFLLLLHAPSLIAVLGVVATAPVSDLVLRPHLGDFVLVGFLLYLLALLLPFANLLWVLVLKLVLDRGLYRSNVEPGLYPKWSRAHLRTWRSERLTQSVLLPLGTMIRSAPLMAWALRQLGATVGKNLQCAHDVEFSGPLDLLSIEDDVAIQTGAYVSTASWVGQELEVGRVRLGSGCTIGMRAAVDQVTVGRGSWITPLTPALADVGPDEIWEGAPARFVGRCTELRRSSSGSRYARPFWLLETRNVLMQVGLEFVLQILPAAGVAWWAATFIFAEEARRAGRYLAAVPSPEVFWHMALYACVTGWITIVLTSVLGCLLVRWTSASPGLIPTRGLRAALLLYRVKKLNQIQRLWTWTVVGQYLRALAGVRFTRVGASESDLMINLVPELTVAHSQVFWSHGCFTNMLDHRARYLKLCQLDMPENFFASNNCVAESGQLPSNFLLGVSTPGNDIRFRRQMRSRLGVPTTVAGNPPVRFGNPDVGAGHRDDVPGFGLFLGRVALNDLFSIGLLPVTEVLAFAVVYTGLLRSFHHPVLSALAAPILVEAFLVCASVLVKKVLVGKTWGSDHSTPFWSWRHFTYFFAQDCFFAWCRRPLRLLSGTVLANHVLRQMGCRIGKRTLLSASLQAFDWNAVSVGDDCVVAGLLQLHSFENMTLQVKRTEIQSGSSINVGAMVMGGALVEPETTLRPLSLVLKGMHLAAASYEGSPAEPVGVA
jgi:non-ribosomal peptide synthetase-like protein